MKKPKIPKYNPMYDDLDIAGYGMAVRDYERFLPDEEEILDIITNSTPLTFRGMAKAIAKRIGK